MIKFSIIGFGHIGRRHATIANEYPNCKVVSVVDINSLAKEHELFPKDAKYFQSIEEFLEAKVDCDVVNLATPNGYHCSYAIKCLEAGYHVVIEKPMGLTKARM
jgi:UDP-N-acetyl-2-amino-2-deoxyglucuronate dehydrogenase